MKFCILSQYYPPEIGAPQARLSEMARHFVERGHSVTVLTAMPNYPTGKIFNGYRGIYMREHREGLVIIRSFIYPTQEATLIRRLANYFSFVISSAILGSFLLAPPDYLLVESPPLFLGFSGVWLSKLKRTKLIFNVSDLWPESAVRLGLISRESRSFRLSSWLEGFCYRHAWLVSGQSKDIISDISKRYPGLPTFHLSNGADTQRFSPEKASDEARRTLGGNEKKVVLYAGLHGLAQGLDQVLIACDALRDMGALHFVFIGDGPEKKALIAHAERKDLRNVTFLDPLPSKQMPALVASADIVIVPLKRYIPGAVPSKIYEAMASGKPVLLVAEGEAEAIIRDNSAGLVVPPGDTDGLAKAITRLYNDSELRQTMGCNGRKAAVNYFDRRTIAQGFIQHLEENMIC
jgi:colanic acid biosynthesis glycosyl transferase WcaI